MHRFNRSLVLAVAIGGLCGGAAAVSAGLPAAGQPVQRVNLEHKYPRMHNALSHLHEARHELESSEEVFKGHRAEALDHVDQAIKHAEEGLREQHDEAANPFVPPAGGRTNLARFGHMHAALDHLREAHTELDNAGRIFGGHLEQALEHTNRAIRQLEDAIRDAER